MRHGAGSTLTDARETRSEAGRRNRPGRGAEAADGSSGPSRWRVCCSHSEPAASPSAEQPQGPASGRLGLRAAATRPRRRDAGAFRLRLTQGEGLHAIGRKRCNTGPAAAASVRRGQQPRKNLDGLPAGGQGGTLDISLPHPVPGPRVTSGPAIPLALDALHHHGARVFRAPCHDKARGTRVNSEKSST